MLKDDNASINSVTRLSPHEVWFGHKPKLPQIFAKPVDVEDIAIDVEALQQLVEEVLEMREAQET